MEPTLIGQKVNKCMELHTSVDDLIKRLFLNFEVQPRIGFCHGTRCSGTYVINVLYAMSYDMDKNLGTDYHERFKRWVKMFQSGDLTCTLAATDVGGDRSKRVSEQMDPDMYTHIVERKKMGLCIRPAISVNYHLEIFKEFYATTGIEMSSKDFLKAGERIWNIKRLFNVREGASSKDDMPPYRC